MRLERKCGKFLLGILKLEDKMVITKKVIQHFEYEQKEFGTKIALSNFIWGLTSTLLEDIGVKQIKTAYKRVKNG